MEKNHTKILVQEGSKNKKHLRGSTQAAIHPLAIILTAALWALVSIIAEGSIVALILPPLWFLYYYSRVSGHSPVLLRYRESSAMSEYLVLPLTAVMTKRFPAVVDTFT